MPDAIIFVKRFWTLALLAISTLVFIVNTALPSSSKITYGFAAYYTSSRLLMEHHNGSIFYDDIAFRAEVERTTNGQASDIYWANPPTTAIMFMPLVFLSPIEARHLWIGVSFLFLVIAIVLFGGVLYKAPFQAKPFYLVTSAFLFSMPLARNFNDGQAYVLLLAFYALALYALDSCNDWLAVFCLAAVLLLKTSGLPLLALLAIRGCWRLVGRVFVGFMVLSIISLPWVDTSTWQIYLLRAVPNFIADPVISVTAYQTVPGFIHHLFVYDLIWNPGPLKNWPNFADAASWLIILALVIIAGVRSKNASLEWTFCVGLLLSVILIPAAEQYHYVLLFPAFLFAFSSPQSPRVPLLIAATLVALPLMYTSVSLTQGWWSLFAYPRLYGGILLYILLLITCNEPKPNPLTSGH